MSALASLCAGELIGSRETGASRWLPLLLSALAAGLAAVALLGPLVTGVVDYRVTETLRNQTIGLDAVSLFFVAPLALLSALLIRRAHVAGLAIALGIGSYTAYMFLQYAVGPDYAHLPGNNERLFPLVLFLFAAGWIVVLAAWSTIDVARLPDSARRDRLIGRFLLPVLALVAFSRYVPQLMDWMSSSPEDENISRGLASHGRSRRSTSASSFPLRRLLVSGLFAAPGGHTKRCTRWWVGLGSLARPWHRWRSSCT